MSAPVDIDLDFASGKSQEMLRRQHDRAGKALVQKVQSQVDVSGAYQAARNLRKQGYGIDVALALVAGRV